MRKIIENIGFTYSFTYEREQNEINKKHLVYKMNQLKK